MKDHGFGWGYTWTKLHLQWKGLVAKAPRKGAHRRKRERRPLPGMMLHQDGSRHAWLEGQPALDLIVTLDDATGAIYSAFLGRGGRHGLDLPGAERGVLRTRPADEPLHRSRGALFPRPKAGRDRPRLSRPRWAGRWSNWGSSISGPIRRRPGADPSGRSRRCRTGWSRSCALAGIVVDRGGQRLHPRGLSARPQPRFAVAAAEPGSAFTPIPGVDLDEILCVQEERQVMNDNCVSYRTLEIANPGKSDARPFRQGAGQGPRLPRRLHALFHGPRCIGRYDENGAIRDAKNAA